MQTVKDPEEVLNDAAQALKALKNDCAEHIGEAGLKIIDVLVQEITELKEGMPDARLALDNIETERKTGAKEERLAKELFDKALERLVKARVMEHRTFSMMVDAQQLCYRKPTKLYERVMQLDVLVRGRNKRQKTEEATAEM